MLLRISNAQTLSVTEQNFLKNIETNMPSTIELLKQTVNINSGTYNVQGVKKVGAIYGKAFSDLGFTVEWIKLPDSLKRAGHLVAYKKAASRQTTHPGQRRIRQEKLLAMLGKL